MQDRKTYGQVTGTPEELQYPRSYLVEAEGAVYRHIGALDQKRPSKGKQAGIGNRTTVDWNFNLGIGENHRSPSSLNNADADLHITAVLR
ncbi:hypothetical protein PR048_028616 [Dryococelus australis]|uniref:Uncharacterized protein n=1 Tax=Dryococelus australis TaxID=614101 RepID=A0ABQ9GDV3_9NEOP|nr:hypothetical protein PR048_028616 [Dryococelus australis]